MALAVQKYLRTALILRTFRSHLQRDVARAVVSYYAVHEHEDHSMGRCLRALRLNTVLQAAPKYASRHSNFTAKVHYFAALRNYSIHRKGEAHAKRLRSDKLVDKSKKALAKRNMPGFHRRSASICSSKTFKTALTSARSLSTRRSTSSVPMMSPAPTPAATGRAAAYQDMYNEVDLLKDQLCQANRAMAEMQRMMVEQNRRYQEKAEEQQNQLRQAIEESLGPGAASPAKTRPDHDDQAAQIELQEQMQILADAKAQSKADQTAQKEQWEQVMWSQFQRDENRLPAPPEGSDQVPSAPLNHSMQAASIDTSLSSQAAELERMQNDLLGAARQNSAYGAVANNRSNSSNIRNVAAGLPAIVGSGLQHIIDGTRSVEQSSELQLILKSIAEMRDELAAVKNSAQPTTAAPSGSSFMGHQESVMKIVDQELTLIAEEFTITSKQRAAQIRLAN